jgi:hypothetical protein
MAPIPSTAPGPSSNLQAPAFDPYATGPGSALAPPSLLPSSPAAPSYGTPGYGAPGYGVPAYGSPAPSYPQPYTYGQPSATPYYPQPYPGTTPPYIGFGQTSPPVLFPGLFGQSQSAAGTAASGTPLKLFQHVRLSEAWLLGDSSKPSDLRINDTFVTTTIAMPNFFWTGQPWFIAPGFGLHNWAGPWDGVLAPGGVSHALPPNAYSAFLDLGWHSDPNRQFGGELGGRIGVFTDFNTFQTESVRPSGLALLRYSLTPTLAMKAGVSYINRADIKLLPAGGLVWTPNPQTRWDIFFPQPKLASYMTTLGNYDLWWYVGGEYGGGTWTVETLHAPPNDKQLMDINDIRVLLGLELGPPASGGVGQRGVFFEVGYVFRREVVFVATPADSFKPNEAIMFRGGFAF